MVSAAACAGTLVLWLVGGVTRAGTLGLWLAHSVTAVSPPPPLLSLPPPTQLVTVETPFIRVSVRIRIRHIRQIMTDPLFSVLSMNDTLHINHCVFSQSVLHAVFKCAVSSDVQCSIQNRVFILNTV